MAKYRIKKEYDELEKAYYIVQRKAWWWPIWREVEEFTTYERAEYFILLMRGL